MADILRTARLWALIWACLGAGLACAGALVGWIIDIGTLRVTSGQPDWLTQATIQGIFGLVYGGLCGLVFALLRAAFRQSTARRIGAVLAAATLGIISGAVVIVLNVLAVLIVEGLLLQDIVGALLTASALGGLSGIATLYHTRRRVATVHIAHS